MLSRHGRRSGTRCCRGLRAGNPRPADRRLRVDRKHGDSNNALDVRGGRRTSRVPAGMGPAIASPRRTGFPQRSSSIRDTDLSRRARNVHAFGSRGKVDASMKDRVSWFGRTGRTVRFVVFMAAVVFGPGGTIFADDHVYVLRDGTRVPLIRSKQEVGVVLRSRYLSREARVRLESAAKTRLRDLPKASRVPMKLLKFSDKGTAGLSVAALRADPAVKAVGAVYRFPGSDVPVIGSRRLVVKVRAGLSDAELLRLWNDYGLEDVQPFEGLDGVYLGRLADPTVDEADAAEALAADDRTVWANPDFYRATTAYQVVPSDEFFDLQWHLNNTGQTGGTPDADIDAVEAWVSATGAGVTFGIFDDGIDVDHEDLAENYLGIGRDLTLPLGVPDSDNPRPKTNTDAHGTAVMGLAVAAGNNVGVRGVAYQAKFTATRGLGS
ncbi:MAG: hypothetical protein D6788_03400, partial [Planctomycetota bacterium]